MTEYLVEPLDLVAVAALVGYALSAYRFRYRANLGFLFTVIGVALTAVAAAAGQVTLASAGGVISFTLLACSATHALWEQLRTTRKTEDERPRTLE